MHLRRDRQPNAGSPLMRSHETRRKVGKRVPLPSINGVEGRHTTQAPGITSNSIRPGTPVSGSPTPIPFPMGWRELPGFFERVFVSAGLPGGYDGSGQGVRTV